MPGIRVSIQIHAQEISLTFHYNLACRAGANGPAGQVMA